MTDAGVSLGLGGSRRPTVRGRWLNIRIVRAVVGLDVRSGGGSLGPHSGRSRRSRIGAAGRRSRSGTRACRRSRAGTTGAARTTAAATSALSKGGRRDCSTSDHHENGFADHGSSPWFGRQSESAGVVPSGRLDVRLPQGFCDFRSHGRLPSASRSQGRVIGATLSSSAAFARSAWTRSRSVSGGAPGAAVVWARTGSVVRNAAMMNFVIPGSSTFTLACPI